MTSTLDDRTRTLPEDSSRLPALQPPYRRSIQLLDPLEDHLQLDDPMDDERRKVKELFGDTVGTYRASFACSHCRIPGRLFVTDKAVLFYSTLLGFERRIALPHMEIMEAELFRVTSISLTTFEGEIYVFKSFSNREYVLRLIQVFMATTQTSFSRQTSVQSLPDHHNRSQQDGIVLPTRTGPFVTTPRRDTDPFTTATPSRCRHNDHGGTPFTTTSWPATITGELFTSNRRRAVSDSIVSNPHDTTRNGVVDHHHHLPNRASLDDYDVTDDHSNHADHYTTADYASHDIGNKHRNDDEINHEQHSHHGNISVPTRNALHREYPFHDAILPQKQHEQPDKPQTLKSWEAIIQEKPLQETGIESMNLVCSLETFFATFLSDTATFSLLRFQGEIIKDRNVEATPWNILEQWDNPIVIHMARTLTFVHPIKTKMGLGPSEARTTRQQNLWKYPNRGLFIENVTVVEGIPAADVFRIRDRWIVEQVDHDMVRFSSSFEIQFTKRSLFRSIIEKSVKKETTDWWLYYAETIQDVLATATPTPAPVYDANTVPSTDIVPTPLVSLLSTVVRLLMLVVALLLIIVLLLAVHIFHLHEDLARIRTVLSKAILIHQVYGEDGITSACVS